MSAISNQLKESFVMNHSSDAPTCEIITIGTELLLGQIIDTNTAYLARELSRIGVQIRFRTSVGDQLEEIVSVIGRAVERCDMVITTGGLGPTLDDLTREAVARVSDVVLEFRQDLMDEIEQIFRHAGYQMPENNRRQAFVPAGSHAISNPVGTAPAFIMEADKKPVISLPGVPRELKFLTVQDVIPWLQKRFNLADHTLIYRVLKTAGIGESKVDGIIGDLMGSEKNPEVGLLASTGQITIRIAARARDMNEAEALIGPVEEEIRSRLREKIFGQDDDSLEGVVDSLLTRQALTLAILETFSGGLIGHKLHGLPSSRLVQSRVIPDKEQIIQWLGKGNKLLEGEEAFSLAAKIRESAGADVGLAVLGFLEGAEDAYSVKGYAAVSGDGIEKSFSWQMGGDLKTLQERGSVIGLNTLRLALLSHVNW